MIKDERFLKILSECQWVYSFDKNFNQCFYLVWKNNFIILFYQVNVIMHINNSEYSPIHQWILKLNQEDDYGAIVIRNTIEDFFALGETTRAWLIEIHPNNYIQFELRYQV